MRRILFALATAAILAGCAPLPPGTFAFSSFAPALKSTDHEDKIPGRHLVLVKISKLHVDFSVFWNNAAGCNIFIDKEKHFTNEFLAATIIVADRVFENSDVRLAKKDYPHEKADYESIFVVQPERSSTQVSPNIYLVSPTFESSSTFSIRIQHLGGKFGANEEFAEGSVEEHLEWPDGGEFCQRVAELVERPASGAYHDAMMKLDQTLRNLATSSAP